MHTRTFIFPTDNPDWAVLATIPPEGLARLERWLQAYKRYSELDSEFTMMGFSNLPEATFEVISPNDLDAEDDMAELFDGVFGEGAIYQLGKPLDPSSYTPIAADVCGIEADADGLRIVFYVEDYEDGLEVPLVHWSMLGLEDDDKRCRYKDCEEAHPVAEANELVTCHTCRREMFSTEEGEESQ
jgi:hypothetical protein